LFLFSLEFFQGSFSFLFLWQAQVHSGGSTWGSRVRVTSTCLVVNL
jgi:hypothetical protein